MNYTVKLVQDEDACSPQENSDDHESRRVFLVTTNNRHFVVRHEGMEADGLIKRDGDRYSFSAKLRKTHHIYPLVAYIHSGIALSLGTQYPFNDPWDAGQIGHVIVTKDTSEITDPLKAAEALVEEWNQYLSGDVWGYVVRDEADNVVDSCWGFYGRKFAADEGATALANMVKREMRETVKIERMMHV